MPEEIAKAIPELLMLTTEELLVLHTPPDVALARMVESPSHIVPEPVIEGIADDTFLIAWL